MKSTVRLQLVSTVASYDPKLLRFVKLIPPQVTTFRSAKTLSSGLLQDREVMLSLRDPWLAQLISNTEELSQRRSGSVVPCIALRRVEKISLWVLAR